ncbi:MAG TPA: hypothetical protein VMN39_01250 [Longimicrobiaceae bacterium]|nr:hypothetical protein [Longimicrobiaceae bacterium]
MVRARSVLLILFLSAGSLSPPALVAQGSPVTAQSAEAGRGFALEQNYPNPVNPETWIPFYLDPSLFAQARSPRVTIRIYNILNQPVAIPEAMDHARGRGTRVLSLEYEEPGRKIAYWDGRDLAGTPVPSGVYYMQLVVEDETQTRKLVVLNERSRRRIIPW